MGDILIENSLNRSVGGKAMTAGEGGDPWAADPLVWRSVHLLSWLV